MSPSFPLLQAVIGGFDVVDLEIPPNLMVQAAYLSGLDPTSIEMNQEQLDPRTAGAIQELWREPITKEVVKNIEPGLKDVQVCAKSYLHASE